MKTKKLTDSQVRSLGAYALLLLTGLNTALAHAQAAHIALPLWVSAYVIPLVAGGVMLLSRSLDKANSGNGAGLVGKPGSAETATAQPATVPTPTAPSPQDFARAVQPLLAQTLNSLAAKWEQSKQTEQSKQATAGSAVLDLLLTNASALTEPRQLALLASAGTHLTEQSGETAQTLMGAKRMDSAALMAGIAAKAGEVKADPPAPAEEPKQPGVIAQIVTAVLSKPEDKTPTENKTPTEITVPAGEPSIFASAATGPSAEQGGTS